MNPIWYGIILMLIQVGIFVWILDLIDQKPQVIEEHGHDDHH